MADGFDSVHEARARTAAAIAERRTLLERWQSDDVMRHPKWQLRAKLAAAHFLPGWRVADIGCGNMTLEALLPADCTYLPYDVCPRDHRTTIIDLNCTPLPRIEADVIVVLGVLEYLFDPRTLLAQARASDCVLVFSYHPDEPTFQMDRRAYNWVSDLSTFDVTEACFKGGFSSLGIEPALPSEYLFVARP